MSTTVLAPSGLEITSNHEDGQAMLDSLTKTDDKTPRVLVEKGEPVKPEGEEKDETQKAASVLGKKGGEAAAKARKAEAKAKPDEEKPEAKEAKPAYDKAKDEKAAKGTAEAEEDDEAEEGKEKLGNPRHDPKARISVLAREKREAQDRADRAERELAEARRAPVARQDAPAARDTRTADQPAARATQDDPSDPEPQESDIDSGKYADYPAFVKAAARWAARDEQKQVQTRQAHEAGHKKWVETVQTHVDTFHERLTGLKKGDAGQGKAFEEFMSTLPDAIVAPSSVQVLAHAAKTNQPNLRPGPENLMSDLIMKSNKPREIFEYFADNLDDYQRIAALQDPSGDPRQTAVLIQVEMAILSHRLDAVTADISSEREVSRAGSPGRSVPGSPRAAEPNLLSADFEDHLRLKRAARK